ncbi:HNH endonuclease signature motif containing protein [Streptomyces sp. MCL20-2]|uniref:HNH endonuclease signature motif containing protein n=1 Tax=Streptomyces sp. MCL20-2 TaxID=2967219 RepID=UPI0029667E0A|nr:HNH endonuclease signature motif containing protein [Streptomyces sp. MCL20-2]
MANDHRITNPEQYAAKFEAKVRRTDTCWIWTGSIDGYGYGRLKGNDRYIRAHRLAHELFIGAIPEGLHVDHICHNSDEDCVGGDGCQHRRCVNPAHLEAVTHQVNLLRGKTIVAAAARSTHCPKGHPYDEANTIVQGDGKRRCRTCRQASERRRGRRDRYDVPTPVVRLIQEHFPGQDLASVLDRAVRFLAHECANHRAA